MAKKKFINQLYRKNKSSMVTSKMLQEQSVNAILADSENRTLWINGSPYGNAYVKPDTNNDYDRLDPSNQEKYGPIHAEIFNDFDTNTAEGNYSHSEGKGTQTYNEGEHAEGKYNYSIKSEDIEIDELDTDAKKSKGTISTIGIGANEENRKNAFRVDNSGEVYIVGVDSTLPDGRKVSYDPCTYDGTKKTVETRSLQEVIQGLGTMQEVTYGELRTLIDNKRLIPGMQYRITDYANNSDIFTEEYEDKFKFAANQFDIIVVADSENTLNKNARACKHDFQNDIYKIANNIIFSNIDINNILDSELLNEHPEYILSYENYLKYNKANETIKSQYPNEVKLIYNNINNQVENLKVKDSYFDFSDMNQWKLQYNINVDNIYYKDTVNNSKIILNVTLPNNTYEIREYVFESNVNILYKEKQYLYKWRISKYQKANNDKQYDFLYNSENTIIDVKPFKTIDNNKIFNEDYDKILLTSLQYPSKENTGDILVCEDEQLYSVDNLFDNNSKNIKIGKQYYNEELILFSLQNNFVNNYFDANENKFDENEIINQTNQNIYNFLYAGPVFYNGKQVHKWYKVKLSNGFTNNEDIEPYNNVLYNNYEVRNFQKEIDNINGYEYYTYVLSEELTPLYKGDSDAVNNYNSQRFIYSNKYEGSDVNYNPQSTKNNKIDGSFEKINYNNIDYSYNDFYNTANNKYYYDTAGAPVAKGIWNINKNTDGSYNIEINKSFNINTKFIENKLFREYVNIDLNNKLWLGEGSRFIVNYCYMADTNNINNAITIFYKPENYIGDDYPIHYQCNKSYIYSKNVNTNGNITTQYYSVWEIQGVNIDENLSNNIILIGGPNGYFKSIDEVNNFNNNLTIDTLKQCFGSYKNDTKSKVYLVNIVDTVNSINFIDMLKPIQTTSNKKQLFKYKYLKFSSILNNKVTFDYFNNPKNIDNTNKKLFLKRVFKDRYSYPEEPIVTDNNNIQYFPNNNTSYKALDLFYNNYKYKNIFNTNYKYYDQVNKENINNFEILSEFTDNYNIYISVKETSETINIFNYFDKDYLVKGIITYLEDEFNNICQYDFKNIKFGLEITNLDLNKINGLNGKDKLNNIGVEAQNEKIPTINNFYYTYSEVYNNIVKDASVNSTYNIINNKIIYNNSNNILSSNIFINSNIINNIIVNCDNLTIHQIDLSTNSFINCKKELKTSISNDFYYIDSNIIWNKGYFYINNNNFNNCSDIIISKEYDLLNDITTEIENINTNDTVDSSLLINIENNSINEYNKKIINKNLYNSLLFNNSNINYYTIDSSINILSENDINIDTGNSVNIDTENDVNINTKHNVNIDTENDVNINSNNTNVLSTTKYNKFTAVNETKDILGNIITPDNGIEGQSTEIVSDDKKIHNSKKLTFSYSSNNSSESNLNFTKLSRYTVSEYDEDHNNSKVYYPNAGGSGINSYDNNFYVSPYHYWDPNYNRYKDINNVKKITFTQPLITITNKNIIGDKNNYLFSYLDINDLHTDNFIEGFKEYINEASISFVNYYYGWNISDKYSEPMYCVSNIKYKISYTILYNKIEYNAKNDLFATHSCGEVIGSFDLNNTDNKSFMTTISSSNDVCFNGIIAINSLKYVNNIEDIIKQNLNRIIGDAAVKIGNNTVNIAYYNESDTFIRYTNNDIGKLTYEIIKSNASKASNGLFEFYVPSEIKFNLETSLDDVGYAVQLGKKCYDYFVSNQIYAMPNSKIKTYTGNNSVSEIIDNAYSENHGVLFKKLYDEDHSTLDSQRDEAIGLSTEYGNSYASLVKDNNKNIFSYNTFISKLKADLNIKEDPFYLTQRKLTNDSTNITDIGKNGVYTGNNGLIVFANSTSDKGEIYNNYIRLFFNDDSEHNNLGKGVPCIAYKYGNDSEVVKGLPNLLNLLQ